MTVSGIRAYRAIDMYLYDFCIFVATYSKDFRLAKICCESIRHFYPTLPIIILRDGDFSVDQLFALGNVYLYDDSQTPEPLRGAKGAFAKLKLFFNPYAERFLYLDADVVMIGPILDLPYQEFDFYLQGDSYDLSTIEGRKNLASVQYDIDAVRAYDPGFARETNTVNAFVTGVWFGRANALALDAVATPYQYYLSLTPEKQLLFSRLYEQGILSYLLFKYESENLIRLGIGQFEIRPGKDESRQHSSLNLDAVKSKTFRGWFNLHYTTPRRNIILRRMGYGQIPFYFNQRFYRRFPFWVQLCDDLKRFPLVVNAGLRVAGRLVGKARLKVSTPPN